MPTWVLFGGLAGVVVIVCFVVLLARRTDSASARSAPTGAGPGVPAVSPGNNAGAGSGRSLVPLVGRGGTASPGNGAGTPLNDTQNNLNSTPGSLVASVHPPGTISFSPDLFYIQICSTPSRDIAERNAKFLADHGVDVSIEVTAVTSDNQAMYAILTAQGFKSQSDAKSEAARIKAVGQQLAQKYRAPQGFNDLVVQRIRRPASEIR